MRYVKIGLAIIYFFYFGPLLCQNSGLPKRDCNKHRRTFCKQELKYRNFYLEPTGCQSVVILQIYRCFRIFKIYFKNTSTAYNVAKQCNRLMPSRSSTPSTLVFQTNIPISNFLFCKMLYDTDCQSDKSQVP